MSFDGIFTHLMVEELANQLQNGRVHKIQQPYDHEIVLIVRVQRQNHKLLLSANSNYARIQLTNMRYDNPTTPPNFVMMLRKYLEGAILQSIEQVANDRIIHLTFSHRDELGDLENIVLVVELMGRHSTILLLNQETGKILDAVKHIGLSQNTYRTLLPGATYIAPPKQEVLNPFTADDTQIFDRLSTLEEVTGKALQTQFQGLGRDTADELAFRLNEKPNEKIAVWSDFFTALTQHTQPTYTKTEKREFFTPIVYHHLEQQQIEHDTYPSLSQLLDSFYIEKAERDRVKQQGNFLIKRVENEIKRNQTKLKKREKTLADSKNAEEFRQKGELLTTFMNQVPRGKDQVELANYYNENQPLKISLDPALSPSQNAQKYFQRYQKLRNAVKVVGQQIKDAKDELAYLESVMAQIELASPSDLKLIREELTTQGYIKSPSKKKKKQEKKSQPEHFLASDGTPILVGKNNLQNDRLTMKSAKKTDHWLHAKDIPGSHVIIRSADPAEETVIEAAKLAAYFSKYRFSSSVPVDMVQVKHIRKPNGAKPGFVIYENQNTYFVTPSKADIDQLKKE
ncbi:NFACT family protein [Tetragenococcus halophilus]|uniref:Rqc2 homolog RqcH n=2 Tax=Tetragenococcus halophilus TaxID=51669 RepID=A0A2H6D3X1_TETHA|nr:NFACT RNA binding domain-containing protein [Tetragenococcus halophilus]AOF48820.1 fibronectin-binding protein [Tetragenococcus halophilus]MCF1601145.1 NFACT family protein [Tetragenococcus halophilus]MCF1675968.1 NFACT family protein [Tetragenococcus halophilus]MCO8285695.1 fibronectin/fibrinogen-binding protein [Tetragenococcus halophilus]MCO8287831.1 fibronectin/fibrinogen-binding protein [Tetragenococcus halophilus]